jgi:single-strand DNA-binding protein
MVYIEGRLKTRKWQDEKGLDRYSTEIHCTDFTFLTPKGESNSASNNNSGQNAQKPEPTSAPQNNNSVSEEEDDLPF